MCACCAVLSSSEKMDVQDHYTAWRQTQEQPSRRHGNDGPFSFCSYPFLLDPRAKSNLLHIEARFQMEQVRQRTAVVGSVCRDVGMLGSLHIGDLLASDFGVTDIRSTAAAVRCTL